MLAQASIQTVSRKRIACIGSLLTRSVCDIWCWNIWRISSVDGTAQTTPFDVVDLTMSGRIAANPNVVKELVEYCPFQASTKRRSRYRIDRHRVPAYGSLCTVSDWTRDVAATHDGSLQDFAQAGPILAWDTTSIAVIASSAASVDLLLDPLLRVLHLSPVVV
jgi:hypothetical protein